MGLSSAGIGSNLDVNSIVTQLMSVEQKPLALLASRESSYQAKLSGFGTLKSALAQFQTAVTALTDIGKFQGMRASAADAGVASASISSILGSNAVPGSYALDVTKLAQAQKLAAVGQASASTPLGLGASTTISFDFGTISGGTFDAITGKYTGAGFASNGSGIKSVTIDASNNTLAGIRDAINKAKVGVSAAIINDGGAAPYRLVLTDTASGSAGSIKIAVSGDATLQALLAHDPGAAPAAQALQETVTAQNAEFKVDGIAISKSTNTIGDAIAGVTINLVKNSTGAPGSSTITVGRDTATIATSVNDFIKAYNDLSKTLQDATSFDAATRTAAVLNGEPAVRALQSQVRSVLAAPVAGAASAFSLLSQIGVTLQKDGSLALDNAKLQTAIASNAGDIGTLFAATGKTSDALVSYVGAGSKSVPGTYAIFVSQLATKGSVTGTAPAGLNITTGSNDTLQVVLDGVTATIALTQANYANAAALATELQSKINGAYASAGGSATVTESGGVLTITSNRYGSGSNASISGGNGQANLNLGTGASATAGLDTAGTINGAAAIGSGLNLTGASGNAADGIIVSINGGITGNRGTVNHAQGYAERFKQLSTALLSRDGIIAARTDGINASIASIAKSRDELNAQLTETEKRYRAQFTALDLAISKMTTTSTFLTQQLASIAATTANG